MLIKAVTPIHHNHCPNCVFLGKDDSHSQLDFYFCKKWKELNIRHGEESAEFRSMHIDDYMTRVQEKGPFNENSAYRICYELVEERGIWEIENHHVKAA